jgi:hypothetical protein
MDMKVRVGGRTSLGVAAVAAVLLVAIPSALGAINSTTDSGQTVGGVTTGDCLHGSLVNCNDYAQKQDVFLNGSPSKDVAGTYSFAVLVPGGQPDPNDGGAKNLSDQTCAPYSGCPGPTNSDSTSIPSGDPSSNREFSVADDGTITNLGDHYFDSGGNGGKGSLSVWPFDDTTNHGGVYILAVCKISDDQNTEAIAVPTDLKGSDCKYDAFKVEASQTEQTPQDLVVTKDATPTFTRTFGWTIDKSVGDPTTQDIADGSSATFDYTVTATHDGGTDSLWQVDGTISVFNPNSTIDFTGVDVSDQITYDDGSGEVADPNASCSITDANGGVDETIPAGDTVEFPYTCTYSGPPAATDETNNATATWDPLIGAPDASNTFPFDFSFPDTPTTLVDNCTDVTDTFNGGSADDLGTVCADGTHGTLNSTLDDFDASYTSPTWTFTYSRTVSGVAGTCTDYDNTATFTTTDTSDTDSSGPVEVTVCVGEDLGVEKNAAPSYTRTYDWSIAKSVDKTTVSTSGSSATFNYTVAVNQTGFSDSDIQATGTITVTNPNDWESVTLTDVSDSVDNGGDCAITGGDSPTSTIAASGSVTLDYTCTYDALPDDGTNTATASWDASAAYTPDGSAQGTASVSFGAPTSTVHKTITPTDAFNGGSGVNLCTLTSTPLLFCTLTGTDASPFASHTYHYSRTIGVTPDQCVSYDNTAATGTGATSGKTVTVCGPAAGGLTMGFWQNKNGQGVITSYCGGISGNTLRAFLLGYAPFQDLSATATCSQIATYVSNVIKAASCTSSTKTCNSMLKAQMLATALDVYFSDPALGGDKIFAFNGGNAVVLGGVKVDLTNICAMIDGSSGSTCSGSENATSVFGGTPSCQTVSQLLAYAAGQSNVGGSSWYGQVKTKQVLAKDTFDSINNQKATVCT